MIPRRTLALVLALWFSSIAARAQAPEPAEPPASSVLAVSAQIVNPLPGSKLAANVAAFVWNAGSGVNGYWLTIGSSAGTADLYSSGAWTAGTYAIVQNLPMDGRTLYARLYSLVGSAYQSVDATFSAGTGAGIQRADLLGMWWQPLGTEGGPFPISYAQLWTFTPSNCLGNVCGGRRQGWFTQGGSGWVGGQSYPFSWTFQTPVITANFTSSQDLVFVNAIYVGPPYTVLSVVTNKVGPSFLIYAGPVN